MISKKLKKAIGNVLSRGRYILGPEVEGFEKEFAEYCKTRFCVGVANGTDALELALKAVNINPTDQVATVANAGMYSTTAIYAVGATPLYIDIMPHGMNMSPDDLARKITKKTKAIIVTHLFGQMADVDKISGMANKYNIPLIEDCAQAHGARRNNKYAGTYGYCGCFSFYPTKNLGALGDAGAIITNDKALETKIRQLRQYGWKKKYHSDMGQGRNSRLDELQAAILRAKLPYLEKWNKKRRCIAKILTDKLKRLGIITPDNFKEDYVAHLYVIRTPKRNPLKEFLFKNNICSEIHYPVCDHKQDFHKKHFLNYKLPVTEKCNREILTLPCFPEMKEEEIGKVARNIKDFFNARKG